MKLAHFVDSLAVGGAEMVAVEACNLLKAHGEDVDLVLMRSGGALKEALNPAIRVKELKFYKWSNPLGWYRLIRSLKKYDLVHVHMRHTYGRVKLASLLAYFKTRIIFHDHYGDIRNNRTIPWFLKYFLKPSWYVGVSDELVRWAREELSIPDDRSYLLTNTIARQNPSKKNGKQEGIVLVSNIRRTKNIELAITLSNEMNFPLDIIGQLVDYDYYEELLAFRAHNRIRIITDVTDILPLLRNYKLALHTSHSETGPLVLMEYLLVGLPFITFDTGEVVRQVKGLLPRSVLPDFEKESWQKAIREMLAKPYTEEELQRIFEDYFSPSQYVEKLCYIYKCVRGSS